MSTDLVQRARMVFAVDESANGTKLPPATVHMQFSSLCHIIDQIRSGRFRFARKCRFKLKSIHFEVGPHAHRAASFLFSGTLDHHLVSGNRGSPSCVMFLAWNRSFSCAPSFTSGKFRRSAAFCFSG